MPALFVLLLWWLIIQLFSRASCWPFACSAGCPIGLWQPNDRGQERRVPLSSNLSPGQCHIALGLYNRTTQRLKLVQANVPLQDSTLLVGNFDRP